MGLKSWLKRLDRTARGSFASFELLDGITFYYDPRSLDLFMHWAPAPRRATTPTGGPIRPKPCGRSLGPGTPKRRQRGSAAGPSGSHTTGRRW
jgi:hypothetical protein